MFKNNAVWAIAGGAITTIGLVGGGVFGVANALQVHPSTSVTGIQGVTTQKAHSDSTRPVVAPVAPVPVAPAPVVVDEPVAVVAPADPVVIAPAAPAPAAATPDQSARVGDPDCDDSHDGDRSGYDGDSDRSSWDGSRDGDRNGGDGDRDGGDRSGSDGGR